MKLILFSTKQEAQNLIDDINAFLGSNYAQPLETDEGWAVPVMKIATTNKIYDLSTMIVDKKFVAPLVITEPSLELKGTL